MNTSKYTLIFTIVLIILTSCSGGTTSSSLSTYSSPPTTSQPKPANFVVASIIPPQAATNAGTPAPVSVVVSNTGEVGGSSSVILKVNGVDYSAQDVTLAPGESKTVVFQVTEPKQGNYILASGSVTASMSVTQLPMIQATLRLADLPAGFTPISYAEMGVDLSILSSQFGGNKSDWFGFANTGSPSTFCFIFGLNMYPLTTLQQVSFDSDMIVYQVNPAKAIQDFESGFGSTFTSYEILTSLSKIGDKSLGLRCHLSESGINFILDVVMFRVADTVTVYYQMWIDGTGFNLPSETFVKLIESRIKAVVASR